MKDRQNERKLTRDMVETHAKSLGYSHHSEQYSGWLIRLCPAHDWPGRDLIDLENMGDGPAWLRDAICGHEVELLSDSYADDWFAEKLGEAYLTRSNELGVYSRSDFDSDQDCQSFQEDLIQEFRALIIAWRMAVIESLERAKRA